MFVIGFGFAYAISSEMLPLISFIVSFNLAFFLYKFFIEKTTYWKKISVSAILISLISLVSVTIFLFLEVNRRNRRFYSYLNQNLDSFIDKPFEYILIDLELSLSATLLVGWFLIPLIAGIGYFWSKFCLKEKS